MLQILILALVMKEVYLKRNIQYPCDEPTVIDGFEFAQDMLFAYIESNDAPPFAVPQWVNRKFVYVDCSNRGLVHIPQDIPESAEIVDLSYNLIREISKNDFRKWKKLSILLLGYNCFTEIFDGPIYPICDNINNNQLLIDSEAFLFNPELKWLDIDSNYLRELPKLPKSLGILDISGTQLGNITSDLLSSDLPNLTIFLAAMNCIPLPVGVSCYHNFTISSAFAPSLQVLTLTADSFIHVPTHLLTKTLTDLFLNHNLLTLQKNDFENSPNLRYLDLGHLANPYNKDNCTKGKEILVIPAGIFDPLLQLQILILENNGIQYLPKNLFKYNKNLQFLDLSLSSLGLQIQDPVFAQGLTSLLFLDLSSSTVCRNYTTVSVDVLKLSEVYKSLTSLESLMLGSSPNAFQAEVNIRHHYSIQVNKIANNSFSTMSDLTQLKLISVAGMSIREIEKSSWSKLGSLQHLHVAFNKLDSTDERLSQNLYETQNIYDFTLSHLLQKRMQTQTFSSKTEDEGAAVILDYSHNAITNLSKNGILSLRNVTHLDISYNNIQKLNSFDFDHTTKLERINLAHNSIYSFPPTVFQHLNNLREIKIVSPNIIDLSLLFLANLNANVGVSVRLAVPYDIVIYDTLQNYFKAQGSPFYQISKADLTRNKILTPLYTAEVPVFKTFPNMKFLILDDCEIENLPPNFFEGLKILNQLHLNKNNLKAIPFQALLPLKKLTALSLNENFITDLKGNEFFHHFQNLSYFSVASNSIINISPGFFTNANLEYLDLSRNRISSLNSSVLSPSMLPHLKYLDLRWNNLDCSCNAWLPFFAWYLTDSSEKTQLPGFLPKCSIEIDEYFGGCVSCQSPQDLRGLSVSTFGDNSSCILSDMLAYSIAFSCFTFFFTLVGSVSYSKWAKRLVFRKVNQQFRVQSLRQQKDGALAGCSKGDKVFLFFDTENDEIADWIDATLVPRLTNIPPSIFLTLVGRDNPCGVSANQHSLTQIAESKKVVVFLTENFCNNPKCK